MAANFGPPDRTYVTQAGVVTYWSAHWTAANFDQAAVAAFWGEEMYNVLTEHVIVIDGVSVGVTEAAPVAVVLSPTIVPREGITSANDCICLGDFVNDRAAANSKLYSPLGIAVRLTSKTQYAAIIVADGYAATDDLSMCMFGRAYPDKYDAAALPVSVHDMQVWPWRKG